MMTEAALETPEAPNLEKPVQDFLATHAAWYQQITDCIAILKTRVFKDAALALKAVGPVAERYQKELKFLFDQAPQLAVLPDDLKAALRKSQEEFATLSMEYNDELAMAMRVGESFMRMITRSVARQKQTSHFYTASGAMNGRDTPRSVSINTKA